MARKRNRRGTQNRRGGALIELAFLVPLLGLILFGLLDFSRIFYMAATVSDSARAAAQHGARSNAFTGDAAGMAQVGQDDAADLGSVTVTSQRFCTCANDSVVNCISGTCTEGAPRIYVRTRSRHTFRSVTRFPGIPDNVAIDDAVTIRVQ